MQNYRELIVWQKAMQLVKSVYKLVKLLPKEENFVLSDQMRRAAVSVPSNIAEGFGRATSKDYSHFLSIARGSLLELETQTQIAVMLGYITEEESNESLAFSDECGKMLNAIIKKIDD